MNKNTQVRQQIPECAIHPRRSEDGVGEGRHELAHLIGRLLAQRWLGQQSLTASSTRSASFAEENTRGQPGE